jgi:hypothetical protein
LLSVVVFSVFLLAVAAVATWFLGERTGAIVVICLVLTAVGWAGTRIISVTEIAAIACEGKLPCAVDDEAILAGEDDADGLRQFVALQRLNQSIGWALWGVSIGGIFLITPRRQSRSG